eukprot:EG_transcript_12808
MRASPWPAGPARAAAPRSALGQRGRRASTKDWAKMQVAADITHLVGNTPLVRLNKLTADCPGTVFAKLESFQPMHSIKDRAALAMITGAEQRGLITPGKTVLVEATSGNTGISLACFAAVKGYRLILTMPATMSIERRCLLKAFGVEVILTPGHQGMRGATLKAEEVVRTTPNAFATLQFSNLDNRNVHYLTTGPEVWRDTAGQVDYVVGGVGTAGTLTGVASYLREQGSQCRIVGVEPEESPVLSGGASAPHKIEGLGAGFVPALYDAALVDEVMCVNVQDSCAVARQLARQEGILCGISSGAAAKVALDIARRPESAGKLIVCICPSFGERYLTTVLFDGLRSDAINMPVHDVPPAGGGPTPL